MPNMFSPRSFTSVRLAAAFLGVLCAASLGVASAPAYAETFVIAMSDGDGYGINDCLLSGGACGRIVADAWCESHGLARATAFGPAEDVTGAIVAEAKATEPVAKGALVVSCEP